MHNIPLIGLCTTSGNRKNVGGNGGSDDNCEQNVLGDNNPDDCNNLNGATNNNKINNITNSRNSSSGRSSPFFGHIDFCNFWSKQLHHIRTVFNQSNVWRNYCNCFYSADTTTSRFENEINGSVDGEKQLDIITDRYDVKCVGTPTIPIIDAPEPYVYFIYAYT